MTLPTRSITVRYVNGDEETFEFPAVGEGDPTNLATNIQKCLHEEQFIFELEDRVLIIPKQNILNIEVSPPPSKLPPLTIRNAKLIFESKFLK